MKDNKILPKYVLQNNAISRSIYTMSPNARKCIALAMAYRKLNQKMAEMECPEEKWEPEDILEVEFLAKDFFHAFDIEKSMKGMIQLDKVLKEITGLKAGVVLDTFKNQRGREVERVKYLTWIQYSEIDIKTGRIQIKFSEDIVQYLDGNEFGYCELLLKDIAELKSFYAFRWLEIAQSYESLEGKQGNPKGCWWFERSIEEIRELFGIEDNQYKHFSDLRKKLIEAPIAEINKSNIGITIEPKLIENEYDKREVKGVRMRCKRKEKREKTEKRTLAYKNDDQKLIVQEKIDAPEEKTIKIEINEREEEKFKKTNESLSNAFERITTEEEIKKIEEKSPEMANIFRKLEKNMVERDKTI